MEVEREQTHYYRKILNLAIPNTVENILQTLVGFVDTLMIARIGLVAVTAVGVANNILAVYLAIFIALGVGASSLISRYLGAKSAVDAKVVALQSTVLAALVGLLFGILSLFFGKELLGLMGATQDVLDESYLFFSVVGGTTVFLSLNTVFGSILRATGDTKTPMAVNIKVNLLNIVVDFF